jgi:hypothetical protein
MYMHRYLDILIEDEKQAKMRSPNLLMLKENFKFGMQL